MTILLLELLAARRRGGWFSELTGLDWTISGEWYWWIVGGAVGITVLGGVIKAVRRR